MHKIDTIDFSNLPFGKIFTNHMSVVKYSEGKWGAIEIKEYGPIEVMPSISALHYGQSVFEGMKVFKDEQGDALLFREDAHFQRINKSLNRLEMPTIPEKVFKDAIERLIKEDKEWLIRAGQLYLRPFVFATSSYLGVAASEEYTFIVLACPVGPYYTKPLNLKIEEFYSRSASGGVGCAKASGNYAASLYPTKLAQKEGFDQIIWTDAATHTKIEESGTMNIMMVIDGKLMTPKISNTILAGITRDSFLTLARKNNITVEERDILVTEFIESLEKKTLTELFGIGTAATMTSVASVSYNNKSYTVPLPTEDSISIKIYKELEAIKHGQEKDSQGWVNKIATN